MKDWRKYAKSNIRVVDDEGKMVTLTKKDFDGSVHDIISAMRDDDGKPIKFRKIRIKIKVEVID